MAAKGEIENPDYALQVRDFTGLRWMNITPSDLDAMVEYHDKAWVIIEMKHINSDGCSDGQELMLQRLYTDLKKSGKAVLLVYARNSIEPPYPIPYALCLVEKYKYNDETVYPEDMTVKKLIDSFLRKIDESGREHTKAK